MREGRCGIAGPVRLWKFQRSMVVGGTWPKSAVAAKNAFFECCEPPSALRTRPTGCPGETRHGGVRRRKKTYRKRATHCLRVWAGSRDQLHGGYSGGSKVEGRYHSVHGVSRRGSMVQHLPRSRPITPKSLASGPGLPLSRPISPVSGMLVTGTSCNFPVDRPV